jgi:hypothetical protein
MRVEPQSDAEEMPGADAGAAWTNSERWAWGEIVAGRIADFHKRSGKLDPRRAAGWGTDRRLSANFLRDLLFRREQMAAIPSLGIRIKGAHFDERIDLAHAVAEWPICLESCRFEKPADFTGLRTRSRLAFYRSAFRDVLRFDQCAIQRITLAQARLAKGMFAAQSVIDGALDLNQVRLSGPLDLRGSRIERISLRDGSAGNLDLAFAKVTHELDLSGARVAGAADLANMQIGQSLQLGCSNMRGSRFRNEIKMVAAIVGGDLQMAGATVHGTINANGLEVRRHLFLRAPIPGDDMTGSTETRFLGPIILSHVTVHGFLEFIGATCEGPVDLRNVHVMESLSAWSDDRFTTTFHNWLDLSGARIKGKLDISGTKFGLRVNMQEIRISRDLSAGASADCHTIFQLGLDLSGAWIEGSAIFDDIRFMADSTLSMARIDGGVYLTGDVLIGQKMDLADARIGGHLMIKGRNGKAPRCALELRLQNCAIGGNVEINGEFLGPLSLSGVTIGQHLFMRSQMGETDPPEGAPVFHAVANLAHLDVKGLVDFDGARFHKGLDLSNAKIGQDLRIGVQADGAINLSGAGIDGGARLDQARLGGSVDLSASKIGRQLCLKLERRLDAAGEELRLDLRDAKAGSFQILAPGPNGWASPGFVQFDGLTYDRLGGFGVTTEDEMVGRNAKWHGAWLAAEAPYSPQPYEHLAAALRQAGEGERANEILYLGRERVRREAREKGAWLRWFGLSLLKWSIGYGIGNRYFRALVPTVLLTMLGICMLGPGTVGDVSTASREGVQLTTWLEKAVYSFDQLLPIVQLDDNLSKVRLHGAVEHYYYLHRALGFLLGSFIAAGIAGFTQRART